MLGEKMNPTLSKNMLSFLTFDMKNEPGLQKGEHISKIHFEKGMQISYCCVLL